MVGTQNLYFYRLLDAIFLAKKNGCLDGNKLVIQAGVNFNKYKDKLSEDVFIFDYIDYNSIESYILDADYVITHAGVGSILSSIQKNKKVIVVPRLKKYKEHNDDHQLEIANKFEELGYVLSLKDVEDLSKVMSSVMEFKPKQFLGSNKMFAERFKVELDDFLSK